MDDTTPDTPEQQYLKFRTWMLKPNALPAQRAQLDGLAGMQVLIEDGLWAAWQEAYREGLGQGRAEEKAP